MEDPDWAKVLQYMYEEQPEILYSDENPVDESHFITNEIEIPNKNVARVFEDMRTFGLIENGIPRGTGTNEQNLRKYVLAEKGFDVIHEREMTKSQQETNERSARLSAYLVIGIIIQALASFTNTDGLIVSILYSILILGLLTLVLIDLGPSVLERRSEI